MYCSCSFPPQKQTRKKQIFLNLKMKNILQTTREWDTSGLHQSISLKGGWELAGSQWSSRITMGVQTEDRTEGAEREDERESYLDLTTFYQRAVELFSGFLCVCAVLKRHKAKTLWYTAKVKEAGSKWVKRRICESLETLGWILTLFKRVLTVISCVLRWQTVMFTEKHNTQQWFSQCYFRESNEMCALTFEPRSLKIISTSRIFPNCCK